MGRNVFVSYRYGDYNVRQFRNSDHATSSRDYVNVIEEILQDTEFYYFRGEHDGEDLSGLPEEYIRQTLYDRIFYTSITIVLITPNMRRIGVPERYQWIPQEISYSLRNKNRECGNSNMNVVLCIVIPDRMGNYGHAIRWDGYGNMVVNRYNLFGIIRENLFNRRRDNHSPWNGTYSDGQGYFVLTTWDRFKGNPERYLALAVRNRGNWQDYDVRKTIDPYW